MPAPRYVLTMPLIVFGVLWIVGWAIKSPVVYFSFTAAGFLAAAIILPQACTDYRRGLTGRLRANAGRLRSDADYQHDAWLRGASIGMYGHWTPMVEFRMEDV